MIKGSPSAGGCGSATLSSNFSATFVGPPLATRGIRFGPGPENVKDGFFVGPVTSVCVNRLRYPGMVARSPCIDSLLLLMHPFSRSPSGPHHLAHYGGSSRIRTSPRPKIGGSSPSTSNAAIWIEVCAGRGGATGVEAGFWRLEGGHSTLPANATPVSATFDGAAALGSGVRARRRSLYFGALCRHARSTPLIVGHCLCGGVNGVLCHFRSALMGQGQSAG